MFSFLQLATIPHVCINSYCILQKKKTMSKDNFNVLRVKITQTSIILLVHLSNTANVISKGAQMIVNILVKTIHVTNLKGHI